MITKITLGKSKKHLDRAPKVAQTIRYPFSMYIGHSKKNGTSTYDDILGVNQVNQNCNLRQSTEK